jgi:hypothetical protein
MPLASIEIEPGIWAIGVLPIDEARRATLAPVLQAMAAGRPPDTPVPSMPPYCEVPQEVADTPEASFQLFIGAPPNPADAIRARNWAYEHGVPIVPGVPCPVEALAQATPTASFDAGIGATYFIRSPQPNQGLFGVVPILGTAAFDPARVQYYKIEISGGPLEGWVTLGETHSQSVVDGELEILHADALPPGGYTIRLVLVATDGNYLQPTYDVPIFVLAEPPTITPTP